MGTTIEIAAPAGVWTEINPGAATAIRLENASLTVPLRVAVKATAPGTGDGYFLLWPGAMKVLEEISGLDVGEKIWLRPHDHSGNTGWLNYRFPADVV